MALCSLCEIKMHPGESSQVVNGKMTVSEMLVCPKCGYEWTFDIKTFSVCENNTVTPLQEYINDTMPKFNYIGD